MSLGYELGIIRVSHNTLHTTVDQNNSKAYLGLPGQKEECHPYSHTCSCFQNRASSRQLASQSDAIRCAELISRFPLTAMSIEHRAAPCTTFHDLDRDPPVQVFLPSTDRGGGASRSYRKPEGGVTQECRPTRACRSSDLLRFSARRSRRSPTPTRPSPRALWLRLR